MPPKGTHSTMRASQRSGQLHSPKCVWLIFADHLSEINPYSIATTTIERGQIHFEVALNTVYVWAAHHMVSQILAIRKILILLTNCEECCLLICFIKITWLVKNSCKLAIWDLWNYALLKFHDFKIFQSFNMFAGSEPPKYLVITKYLFNQILFPFFSTPQNHF